MHSHGSSVSNKGATGGGEFNSGAATVWGTGTEVDFYNCSFAGNSPSYGNALTIGGASASLTSCIFWDNGSEPITLADIQQSGSSLAVSHCDIQNGQGSISVKPLSSLDWGEGNIDQNPLFTGSGDLPYTLSEGSPCIDKGNPQSGDLPLPVYDCLGMKRIWDRNGDMNAIIDTGPYEYGSYPAGSRSYTGNNGGMNIHVYPVPFSRSVTFEYELSHPEDTRLWIYDSRGKLVHEFIELQLPGIQKITWTPGNLGGGFYFYRVRAGHYAASGILEFLH